VTLDFAGAELPDVLNRAIHAGPISLTFASSDTARRWVFRAHNYIRRHDPSDAPTYDRPEGECGAD
jgi:hypothetical protein